MIFWDFSIHIIDKFEGWNKFYESKSIFSYAYPHFGGKPPYVTAEKKKARYDFFWISYWGTAFVLLILYICFK